jgi:hypothetical protein
MWKINLEKLGNKLFWFGAALICIGLPFFRRRTKKSLVTANWRTVAACSYLYSFGAIVILIDLYLHR